MRPAVGLFAFVHKEIDLKKMFMQKSKMRFTVTLLLVRAVCAASSAQAPTA